MKPLHFLPLLLLQLLCHSLWSSAAAQTLSTSSRWIVSENGTRVKLACANWPSHLDTMVTEGLSLQPLDKISKNIGAMGFNCVRLTWALYMLTNATMGNLTVRQSFQNHGLNDALAGFQRHNPRLLDLTVVQSFQAVVSNLGSNDIMVIIDNHLSKPGWCCSRTDGNAFFGDIYFDPDTWINGLSKMASMFKGVSNVVGLSLRNELRGQRQSVSDWYRYMQQGAEAVHAANPNVLVILSGLYFDNDLGFLGGKQVQVSFTGKLVFELHWYSFSDSKAWATGNVNEVCGRMTGNVMNKGGFLLKRGFPVFFSEFGMDQRNTNQNDNRYMSCYLAAAADHDWDWAIWSLQGSYYLREGTVGLEEMYGMLSWDWSEIRNPAYLRRISSLQAPFQGPAISNVKPYKVLYYPLTGQCVWTDPNLMLGLCAGTMGAWNYTPEKTLTLEGSNLSLQAVGAGQPVELATLGGNGTDAAAVTWEPTSASKMHLSTKMADGTTLCLDVDSANALVTNPCKCLSGDPTCDPTTQWFKIVDSIKPRSSSSLSSSTSI
ncbi:hypothetical protein ACLOJK_009189 [Asimina triloba]